MCTAPEAHKGLVKNGGSTVKIRVFEMGYMNKTGSVLWPKTRCFPAIRCRGVRFNRFKRPVAAYVFTRGCSGTPFRLLYNAVRPWGRTLPRTKPVVQGRNSHVLLRPLHTSAISETLGFSSGPLQSVLTLKWLNLSANHGRALVPEVSSRDAVGSYWAIGTPRLLCLL